jgi:ubiquinone/menaquinone biosynthesis C-methylase UbiE
MKKEITDKILAETESGYDLMAGKFSETRKYFWRELEFIGDYAKEGDTVLDFGCGNGRLLELFSDKNINYFGADVSARLIGLGKNKYSGKNAEFSKIDPSQTSLPFQDNFFNTVYSIAVFHHFPGKEYREQIAGELYRVTRPGGYAVITVWNLWQKKYLKNILKNWISKLVLKSPLDFNDCYVTFKNNQGAVFSRYHHAFTGKELASIFTGAGFKKEAVKIGKNIVFIGKK